MSKNNVHTSASAAVTVYVKMICHMINYRGGFP